MTLIRGALFCTRLLAALSVVAVAFPTAHLLAQTPPILESTAREEAEAIRLLRSPDPRDQAWGAWLSGRSLLHETIPLLQGVVQQRLGSSGPADSVALDSSLDALIQLKAEVPPELALAVHERNPAEAMILLQLAGPISGAALLSLLESSSDYSWFAAANLALQHRTPGLARVLLAKITISALVAVSDDGSLGAGGGRGGGIGILCGGIGLAPGFPPWPSYRMTVYAKPGVTVLAPGPTLVYYERRMSPAGQTPNHSLAFGDAATTDDRLRYAWALAGRSSSELPVSAQESFELAWSNRTDLDSALQRIRRDIRRRFQQIVAVLVERQALTPDEAASLPPPKIPIRLRDLRNDRATPLRAEAAVPD